MLKVSWLVALAVLAAGSVSALAAPVTIQSGTLSVTCDSDKQELTFSRNGAAFAEHVKWWDGLGKNVTAAAIDIKDDDEGSGKAIKIEGGQGEEQFAILDSMPFVVARVVVKNTSATPLVIKNIVPFSAPLGAGRGDSATRFFSPEGNTDPHQSSASKSFYLYLAAVNPATRAGVVTGWITHEDSSGIVGARLAGDQPVIEPRAEFGKFTVKPNSDFRAQIAVIGDFDDARLGLEALADANAKANGIKLKPVMSGYCTWYYAGALDEKRMKALAEFCNAQHLKDYGFDFLQIDDGWQPKRSETGADGKKITIRDFATYNPGGPYPSGMKATADAITSNGFMAGIWFIPFAWSVEDPVLKDHLDWFVHKADGGVYSVTWAGDCLDMTNPETRTYVQKAVSQMTRDWGYKYIKIDGLWSGMATTILYPNPNYRADDLGGAVFHDPTATNISAYRGGLRAVREAAGDDVFIAGCNVAQNHRTLGSSIGLVDSMRVGPDIKADWGNITSRAAIFATREYFFNGRVWWNDPDCLMLRDPITLDEARTWGSFIALSGQLNVVSEDLPKLAPEKFDIIKRTMPNVPHEARPVDLFTTDGANGDKLAARVWVAKVGQGEAAHAVVGLFNWDAAKSATLGVDAKAVGLEEGDYVGFDYWDNKFVDKLADVQNLTIKPGGCHVISLVKSLGRPQLVSTSRHVLQGGPDVVEVTWDAGTNTLRGKSKVIANDAYELRIVTGPYTLGAATVGAGAISMTGDNGHVRVKFTPAATGEVSWNVTFAPPK